MASRDRRVVPVRMAASCGLRFLRSQAGKTSFVNLSAGLNSELETDADGAPLLLVEAEIQAGEVLVTWLGLQGARLQRKGCPAPREDLNPGNTCQVPWAALRCVRI